jgi:hypothetical protein
MLIIGPPRGLEVVWCGVERPEHIVVDDDEHTEFRFFSYTQCVPESCSSVNMVQITLCRARLDTEWSGTHITGFQFSFNLGAP